jgi:small conductance mechanosensitive channel
MQADEEASKKPTSIKIRVIQLFLVVVASLLAAELIYAVHRNLFPDVYVTPIYLVILLVGGYLGIRIFTAIVFRVAQPTLGLTRGRGVKNFLQIVGGIILILVAFSLFNYDITGALLAGGFTAIVLGLAAQQVLGNIFGGISLLFTRPFEIGDRITMVNSSYGLMAPSYPHEAIYPGYTGIVADVGVFYTTILLDEGVPTVVPNAQMINSLILNHSKVRIRTVRIRIDVDRKIPFNQFQSALMSAIKSKQEDSIIHQKKISIEIIDTSLGTYQVLITVWARSELEEPVRSQILQDALNVVATLSASNPK